LRVVLFSALLLALPAGAQMHKCVDERGVTLYTDKLPPGCKGGEVDIQPIPPVSGKVTPYKEDLKAAERDFKRRQVQREREEAAAARRAAELQKRCARQKVQLERATSARRMDDRLREARLRQLNEEVAKTCR